MITFSTLANDRFQALRASVLAHPRMHGYYIIDLVSIEHLRAIGYTEEAIIDALYDYWNDDPSKPDPTDIPQDQTWQGDYAVSFDEAKELAIEVLVGGSAVGHTVDTIPRALVEHFVTAFINLFDTERRYYARLGLGNREYVFLQGIVVTDPQKAGILWVVEGD